MFLNILKISDSNVLKMFLNIIVQLLFSIRTNQPEAQVRFIESARATLAGKKEIWYKKRFKTNLYMHNQH